MLEMRWIKVVIIVACGCVLSGLSGCGSGGSVTTTPPPANLQLAYVANYTDNTVSGYVINSSAGALTPDSAGPFPAGTGPFSIAVEPSGKFAYVANATSNDVSGF